MQCITIQMRGVRERRASAGVSGWTEVIALNEAHLSFGRCSLEWAACAHAHFTRVRRGQVKVMWFATAAASSVLIYSLLKSWVIYCNAGCFLTRDDCLVITINHSPLHECMNLVNTKVIFFFRVQDVMNSFRMTSIFWLICSIFWRCIRTVSEFQINPKQLEANA